jgi:ABC-2 type transport system permease protein
VLDHDRTAGSRALLESFEASGYFRAAERPGTERRLEELLVLREAHAGLVIPRGFSEALGAGGPAPVQLLLDGSDANTATIAMGYADGVVRRFSRAAVLEGGDLRPPFEVEPRVLYNPTLESRNMIVPGLVAVIMSIIAAMLTALTVAREWERGTMEQLAATPVTRLEVVLGKLLPYLVIGAVDVAVTVGVGLLLFGTPFRGSAALLSAFTLLFLLGALGLGIFISAAVKSQVLATQVAMVATYLPAVLLSGFLYEIASMPIVLRAVTYVVPARYYVVVTRGIFLKGVGLGALWPQAVFMLAFAALGVTLATGVFKKEIA